MKRPAQEAPAVPAVPEAPTVLAVLALPEIRKVLAVLAVLAVPTAPRGRQSRRPTANRQLPSNPAAPAAPAAPRVLAARPDPRRCSSLSAPMRPPGTFPRPCRRGPDFPMPLQCSQSPQSRPRRQSETAFSSGPPVLGGGRRLGRRRLGRRRSGFRCRPASVGVKVDLAAGAVALLRRILVGLLAHSSVDEGLPGVDERMSLRRSRLVLSRCFVQIVR